MAKSKKSKKSEKTETKKVELEEKPKEVEKSASDIVIKETEADVVLSSGFDGDPDNLRNAIKKEAAKSHVLSRFLIPLFTFIAIGLVAAGLTWYYSRPEVAERKTKEQKIENAPKVDGQSQLQGTTPAPAAPAASPAPAASTSTTYTVKEGDTLSSIANANGMTSTELASANGITDPNSLKIGQVLKIPSK